MEKNIGNYLNVDSQIRIFKNYYSPILSIELNYI